MEFLKNAAAVAFFAVLMSVLTVTAWAGPLVEPYTVPMPLPTGWKKTVVTTSTVRPVPIPVVVQTVVRKQTTTVVQPKVVQTTYQAKRTSYSGHTHTCSQGHRWDHTMDGGTHLCPYCGEYQSTQDGYEKENSYPVRRGGIFGRRR
jgi:hypothetical protein